MLTIRLAISIVRPEWHRGSSRGYLFRPAAARIKSAISFG